VAVYRARYWCERQCDLDRARLLASSHAVDRLAAELEEWGTVSMSAPLLVKPDKAFAFDLARTAERYFDDAKAGREGQAASLHQVAQVLSASLKAQYDPTIAAAYDIARQGAIANQGQLDLIRQARLKAAEQERAAAIEVANRETDAATRDKLLAQAERQYADALAAFSSTTTAPPTAAGVNTGLPAVPGETLKGATEARSLLGDAGTMKGYQGLLGDDAAPALSNRAALVMAAGDKTVQAIFDVLGRPDEAVKFQGKKVLLAVAMVAVNPGWRTRKDFAADLRVLASFDYMPARPEVVEKLLACPSEAAKGTEVHVLPDAVKYRLCQDAGMSDELMGLEGSKAAATALGVSSPLPEWLAVDADTTPVVAAVAPMTEAQVLDLGSSLRHQSELALALAGVLQRAGLKADAQAIEQYVRQHQSDARTRTATVAANVYSTSGGMFGFQVGPRFRALEDPGQKDSGPANVLDRQSFPVLVIVGLDQMDLYPKLEWWPTPEFQESTAQALAQRRCRSPGAQPTAEERKILDTPAYSLLRVMEPSLQFVQSPSWMPLDKPWLQRSSETDRTRLTVEASRTLKRLEHLEQDGNPPEHIAAGAEVLSHRGRMLQYAFSGSVCSQPLPVEFMPLQKEAAPVPKLAQIDRVVPGEIVLKRSPTGQIIPQDVTVAVVGRNLQALRISKDTISPVSGQAEVLALPGQGSPLIANEVLVEVCVRVSGCTSPLVLALGLDEKESAITPARGQPANRLFTPPIVVRDGTGEPVTLLSTYSDTAKSQSIQHEIRVSPGASDTALQRAAEVMRSQIEREKAASPPAKTTTTTTTTTQPGG